MAESAQSDRSARRARLFDYWCGTGEAILAFILLVDGLVTRTGSEVVAGVVVALIAAGMLCPVEAWAEGSSSREKVPDA